MVRAIWNYDPDDGNVEHIEQHGLTIDDIEYALEYFDRQAVSRSSGRPMVFAWLPDGRRIAVAFDWIDDDTVYPVTAFEVES
jgi:hypothetical protein